MPYSGPIPSRNRHSAIIAGWMLYLAPPLRFGARVHFANRQVPKFVRVSVRPISAKGAPVMFVFGGSYGATKNITPCF
jgi:hypothetical protein